MTKLDKSYQEDDEIEIVGDTELDKKNAERVDKNFSKMTLKGQREAMEAFKSSTEEEEEEDEEEVQKPHKAEKKGNKRKAMVEEDSDSDIEILDSPDEKRFYSGDGSKCETGDGEEETSRCVSITPMSKTSSNNNKVSSPMNKANSNKESIGEELNSNRQKPDLVQVTKHFSRICFALFGFVPHQLCR